MLARYMADPKYQQAGVANTTIQVCIMLPQRLYGQYVPAMPYEVKRGETFIVIIIE
jgi:hypothetical protein